MEEETPSSHRTTELIAMSDDELMTLARPGSTAAFSELVRRYEKRVRAFCSCLLKNGDQARDAAQETFLKVWAARARYQPRGKFREMLLTVARNECRVRRRRTWLGRMLRPRMVTGDDEYPAPETMALQSERDALLRAALLGLPEKFAVPLTLRFVEGLEYAAIAAVIGRTESAARSRIYYGLKLLGDVLPEGFS